MKEMKLLVFDLDGTLLRSDKNISNRTQEAIARCRKKGLRIAIATARSEQSAARFLALVKPDAVISNGGALVRAGDETVARQTMPLEVADRLMGELTKLPGYVEMSVETDTGYFVSWEGSSSPDYSHSVYHDFRIPLGREAYKITVHLENGSGLDAVAKRFPQCGLIPFAGEPWYRFAHKKATKMEGIRALAAHMGLDVAQIAAFGDDYNDEEMLRECGIGVAMGNAAPAVKKTADAVIGSNDEDGIAKYLEQTFFEGEPELRLWNIYHNGIPEFLQTAAATEAMVRLQDVGMNCGCEYTGFPQFTGLAPYSRFDHSMGVALIVWHFTGDMTQALSGLLHDLATPVFAHVVDFMRGDHMRQESTEEATESMIRGSGELADLLAQWGILLGAVKDYHRYPIADNDSPKLSADRLEYTLGNGVNYGILSEEQAAACYRDLTVGTNEFGETELVFRHLDSAVSFAYTALECAKIYVSDPDRYAMEILAELLKKAVDRGIITEEDLYLQESRVIEKLKESPLREEWERFRGFRETVSSPEPTVQGEWRRIFAKKRFIDPYVQGMGRVSRLNAGFRQQLKTFREASQDYWICAK